MFKLSTSERLHRWKSFRQNLSELPLEQAIIAAQEFWTLCPFCPFYLEDSNTALWPDPWQLIEENIYCDLAKCLGIVYTLHLTSHRESINPEIRIYYDNKTRYSYNIAYLCQGKYVLNLIEDEIVNKKHINQELKLKYRYTAIDLKLEQY